MPRKHTPEGPNEFSKNAASYSPETRGDLLEYLKSCDDEMIANHFYGPSWLKDIIALGIIVPGFTTIRVDQSPQPDDLYFINQANELESDGRGKYNMSAVAAEKGIYSPEKILKNKHWSVSGLRLYK